MRFPKKRVQWLLKFKGKPLLKKVKIVHFLSSKQEVSFPEGSYQVSFLSPSEPDGLIFKKRVFIGQRMRAFLLVNREDKSLNKIFYM